MASGIVKWFDPERGYGFIAQEGNQDDLFVHRTAIAGGGLIHEGDQVEFQIGAGPRGLHAEQVRVTVANPNPPVRRPRNPAYGRPDNSWSDRERERGMPRPYNRD